MPIDTQTFALSKWWMRAGLELVQKNNAIFSAPNLREARREFIAGKNQLNAIKNWLLAAGIIKKNVTGFELSRFGSCIYKNDKDLLKSSTWWAFHLLVCFGEDPFPYSTLFQSLDSNIKQFYSLTTIKKNIYQLSNGKADSSVDTYFEGVIKMFREDGSLQPLGLLEARKDASKKTSSDIYYRLASPIVTDTVILFGLALARMRHFPGRPSIDFGQLIEIGLDHYLALSQDDLKHRLRQIAHSIDWREELSFKEVANLNSIVFGNRFNEERMLISLLQDGTDSWM